MRIKGLDVGYVATKSIGDFDEQIIFKSAYSTSDDIIACDSYIQIDGVDYYVGTGNTISKPDKTDSLMNKVCTLTNLAKTGEDEYFLVVGLPIAQYKSQKDKLITEIMKYNDCEIKYFGQKLNISIKDVTVFPQGAGALYTIEDCVDGEYLIVDVGGYTVDIALIEMINYSPIVKKYDTWFYGMTTIYSQIQNKLNNTYTNLTLEPSNIENIFKFGLKYDDKEIDVYKIIDPIIDKHANKIIVDLDKYYPSYTTDIYLCGGGSKHLYSTFKKHHPNTKLINDSQFANAKGFYCIGQQKYYDYVY